MIGVLRTIFMAIDVAVYWCVEVLLQLVMDLSSVEIFSNSVIDEFSSRIYLILGLVMLFKLMISFIQLLINPDNTKENGVGNLLKRVVISLALIFLVPSIFDLARVVQVEVIPVIPKVILGVGTSEEEDEQVENLMSSASRLMAFYAYKPFFTYQNEDCNDGSILGTSNDDGSVTIWSVVTAFQNRNVENVCSTDENGYMYSYTFLIPTVVGAYLVFVLVTIAVEVAIRAIKLGVCELLAPIPIASYIDPKSSKQTFDKWVNISIKTYLDLFIRLILIYFVIFIFMTVFEEENLSIILENVGGDFGRQGLVIVFIIVGLLQFIKQAPKFLTDMLGLSGAGNLMGMFKGDGFRSIGEATGIPGTAAAVGAGIQNAKYSWTKSRGNEPGARWWTKAASAANALRRGAGGFIGATGRGLTATYKGQGWQGAYRKNLNETTARNEQRVNKQYAKRNYNKTLSDEVSSALVGVNERKTAMEKIRDEMGENYETDVSNARTTLNQAEARRDRAKRNMQAAEAMMSTEVERYNAALRKYNAFNARRTAMETRTSAANHRDDLKRQYENEMAKAPGLRDQEKLQRLREDYLSAETKFREADDNVKAIESQYGSTYDFSENYGDVQDAFHSARTNLNNKKEALGTDALAQEFNDAELEYETAKTEVDRLDKLQVDLDAEKDALKKAEARLETAEKAQKKERIIPIVTDVKVGLAEFMGDSVPKGKDYIDLASHLESQKKAIFQGEGFKKIEENLSLVMANLGDIDSVTGKHTGRFTYKTKDGSKINESFARMLEARQEIAAGAKTVKVGGKEMTAPEFNEYFKAAQKTVGEAYVNAAVDEESPLLNETVRQAQIREIQAINAMNIPNDLKAKYTKQVQEDFGAYLKNATDVAELLRTKGETMRTYERAVEDKK